MLNFADEGPISSNDIQARVIATIETYTGLLKTGDLFKPSIPIPSEKIGKTTAQQLAQRLQFLGTSGWTIIPSQKVRGKVSQWSKSATARRLLDKLSLVNNYIYRQEENVIYLMIKDEYEVLSDELGTNTEKRFSNNHRRIQHQSNTELSGKSVEKTLFFENII